MPNAEYPDLAFVPPRSWTSGRGGYSVQYLVIHYTAGSEGPTSAENGAAYDQRRTDGTSTHYFVDSDSVVQCVYTWDRAHACFQYGNRYGIQYELCGTAQTRAQWLDPVSDATLTNAARQAARDCVKYGLPVRRITPAQMAAGWKGIGGHDTVTLAYGLGDHMDPGAEFPWDIFLQRVQSFMPGAPDPDPAPPIEEDELEMKLAYLFKPAGATPARWVFYGYTPGGAKIVRDTNRQNEGTANAAAYTVGSPVTSTDAEMDAILADFLAE